MFVATTTCRILNESIGTNEYGDSIDSYQAVKSGVPAHIWEEEYSAGEPTDGSLHTYRRLVAMLPSGTDVQKGDRLKDEADDRIYLINHVTANKSFVARMPLKLELEIVE